MLLAPPVLAPAPPPVAVIVSNTELPPFWGLLVDTTAPLPPAPTVTSYDPAATAWEASYLYPPAPPPAARSAPPPPPPATTNTATFAMSSLVYHAE